jgi:hypothetical protein
MAVEKTERDIATLVGQISAGEIRLPEIQRGYVWKPTQVAKLIESLYRGYPSGSLLFWRTSETPQTRAIAANAPTLKPAVLPLYLLDGQQRLTSLHRVFTDHPEAQIVFNIETEAFQNQSAATKQDPRCVRVHDIIRPGADLFEIADRLHDLGIKVARKDMGQRLNGVAAIAKYRYHMEVLDDLPYEEVAQIFVRVNSGGRALRTTDLALATLSARWPGVLTKLEAEADYWRDRAYGDIDLTFITRALTGAVLGRGLSAWSHGRLAAATDEELERGWATVQRGLRHLVPLLKENLGITHSSLLPSTNVLLPPVVLLGERPDEPLDAETANGILYWFLVATIRNRYSGATDTVLSQDIPAARVPDPVRKLLTNLGVVGTRIEVTEQALIGRTIGSPYFFLSFLVCQQAGAKDWWFGTGISAAAEGSQKLEYHHVHPRGTLKADYSKAEINDLANLAFISAKANRKIGDRSPADYFPTLDGAELTAHLIPLDSGVRTAAHFRDFLTARRRLLAEAMTELLDSVRPAWLTAPSTTMDDLTGCSLELVAYQSSWDEARLRVTARTPDRMWSAVIKMDGFVSALDAAQSGIDADVEVGGETVPVRVDGDDVEFPLGPFMVIGSPPAWKRLLDRTVDEARPLSECPALTTRPWDGPRIRFPLTNAD